MEDQIAKAAHISVPSAPISAMPLPPYTSKVKVLDKYHIIGFISSGTYGRVYKARSRHPGTTGEFAIKKFKPDKEGEVINYTGISQSACREMALNSELAHENVIHLHEIILEDKCIYMVFEYAEHDLLQIVHHHSHPERRLIPESTIRSILWQLLNGVSYLHQNWVMHRDLKPANIMVTASGEVKIGDLGLARVFWKPLAALFNGDKVVVTIWYRAPELLLGSRHYTAAIDLWAVGCIFAELLALRPIFKGEEAKMDSKKTVPFQRNQMQKIIEILGTPTKERWPSITQLPEYPQMAPFKPYICSLETWYQQVGATNKLGYELLSGLLEFDPVKRLTAQQALEHRYFTEGPKISLNAFEGSFIEYPHRRVSSDDNDIRTSSLPGTKRSGLPDDSLQPRTKRVKAGE
ncbi:cyclin-dependent protein kinase [Orbilia oligospora]|uniref:Serine/threonine-protein kinase SSN3 n=5 Tax=Orbilia oligospora TaxID=2813651 RepID=A0A7C8VFI4_ORBOL|nr:cyclin-dependent protein kinase [Orbilia oligospora]KAF3086847.1 cyclin-dependent protein kinase [Orbilia oligospora]KAF3088618.1 cyclin-dependent protein kinase [Orbilia oligospora]KAF3126167.1 cyclin-dependent protein kinase [Orbilia oligospora]KAF3140528.1 cyclin-dependent protein kinase [Orbilia oligospora]